VLDATKQRGDNSQKRSNNPKIFFDANLEKFGKTNLEKNSSDLSPHPSLYMTKTLADKVLSLFIKPLNPGVFFKLEEYIFVLKTH
jgi:hypothetical protein